MDKELLIKVLSTSNRVVLPGFGAFLRKAKTEQLIFSPFLKSDDGYLRSVVEQEYGVAGDDASHIIEEFVAHIKDVLSSKSRFYIEGVGTLLVDDNGAIAMVMDTSKQIPASFATDPTQKEPIAQPQPQVQAHSFSGFGATPQTPVTPQPISSPRTQLAQQPEPQQTPVIPPVNRVPQPQRPVVQPQATQGTVQNDFVRPAQPPLSVKGAQQGSQQQQQQQVGQPQNPQNNINSVNQQRPIQSGAVGAQREGQSSVTREGQPQRPVRKPMPVVKKKQKGKGDIWLIIAIVAALLVIALFIYSFIVNNQINAFEL